MTHLASLAKQRRRLSAAIDLAETRIDLAGPDADIETDLDALAAELERLRAERRWVDEAIREHVMLMPVGRAAYFCADHIETEVVQ